jgi:hypothetical protein
MDSLDKIQTWYRKNCNGAWEHQHGISIETIDNPGWCVTISLAESRTDDKKFEAIKIERSDEDWVTCQIQESYFKGYGGPRNLTEILSIFVDWAT